MKKGIDTHFLAARQLVLWTEREVDPALVKALPMPRYVTRRASTAEQAASFIGASKIEVVLVELDRPTQLAELGKLRAADPDLELVLLVDRARLAEFAPAGLDATFEVLARPFSDLEIARRVESARERRYLRRAEQRQKRSEARMGAIVQAVPTGIISVDEEGVVHDWNPAAARIFGHADIDALGRNFWDLVGIDVKALKDDNGRIQLARKFELTVRHKSGAAFPIDMSLVAVPLSERTMMCAIVEDRTVAKRLELELRQAQKLEAIGQLSAGLAHEINTPCQFIADNAAYLSGAVADLGGLMPVYRELLAAAEAAGADPALIDRVRAEEENADLEYCLERLPKVPKLITDGVERIAGIVRAMKSFARPDWSKSASVDLNELVQNVTTVVGHQLASVADVEFDLSPLPPLLGHGGDLHQALFHIVRNSIDAIGARVPTAEARGKIVVRSRPDDAGVELAISDNGCGIPTRVQGRIFEPFFTTKEVGRGTGQGLAVAWSVIVEQHGGRIRFESQEGAGTTFFVHLPLQAVRRPTA